MNVEQIANQLVSYCRTGQYEQAHQELYAETAVSIEPDFAPRPRTEGMEGIRAKGQAWAEMVQEVHNSQVSDPICAGNHFSVTMITDATFKEGGRQQIAEVCVYEVQNGKIVKEQFFYPGPPSQE